MPMHPDDLSRPVLIDVCKDGTISYRVKGKQNQRRLNNAALPVFSVKTEEHAQALQVRFGKLQYGSHPEMLSGTPWYRLFPFSGNVDDLGNVSDMFRSWYLDYEEREQATEE